MKLCVAILFRYPSYRIWVHNSQLDFGGHSKTGLVVSWSEYHFHPQTNGQAERTIQTLEDMLRAFITDFKGYWDKHFPFVEFLYNNSYRSSLSMDPFEAFYGRRCRSPIGWFKVGESSLLVTDMIYKTLMKAYIIRNCLKWPIAGKSLMPIIGEGIWSLKKATRCIWKFHQWNEWLDLERKGNWVLVMWVPMKFMKGLEKLHTSWDYVVN